MPIWSLTWERVEDLRPLAPLESGSGARKQLKEKTQELTELQSLTPEA